MNGAPSFINTVEATINIYNTIRLSVHASINGIGTPWIRAYYSSANSFLPIERREKIIHPWGYSFIYDHRNSNANRIVEFGKRQSGDQVIYIERKRGTKIGTKLAEIEFNYGNEAMPITFVEIYFDVMCTFFSLFTIC